MRPSRRPSRQLSWARLGRTAACVALGGIAWAALQPQTAAAQAARKPARADAGEAAPDAALKAYDAGVRAWQAGKADAAVQQLSSAIAAGKLPPQQMAKALYYRGMAQRKLGKPALAVSDLQSALWLKGGLSESERNDALAARTAAYREAGIADPQAGRAPQSAASVTEQPAAARVSAAPAARSGDGGVTRSAAERPALRDSLSPASAPAQPSAQAAARASSPQSPAPSAAAKSSPAAVPAPFVTTTRSAPPVRTASAPPAAPVSTAVAPQAAPSAAVPAPAPAPVPTGANSQPAAPATTAALGATGKPEGKVEASSGGSILSNLFGGFSLAGDMPSAPPMPERRVPPSPRVDEDPDSGKEPWGSTRVRTASAAPAAAAAAAAAPQFRLQVGAARSKQEAERIAARLKAEQKKALAQRTVEIDQVGADALAVWRVRVGPYASANEPRNLCVKLRQSGYDCMVVAR